MSPALSDAELNALFAAAWPGRGEASFVPVLERSPAWVAARREGRLVGYVNVTPQLPLGGTPRDGGVHAFVLDTTVHPQERRRGLGIRLVRVATEAAGERGARWLHVDYEPHLEPFYEQCGFRPTAAGLLAL
ncbi:GNAT family N-acetyltransferase [Streptomyces sp. NBC_01351]|uniref:GNAT family N-acetyltransferase n=1 Tax=Streptomyces sp. NBC_01351 TaxID=2903833 RepID=UPI002E317D62|nr:GNAT family N-acetyltransferase [Streptomyces sp. NBC_01351]